MINDINYVNLAATFSIVACDLKNGDLGVAVQSKAFSVGTKVPWAVADVGAVATQAWYNISYGINGLRFLKKNFSVEDTIKKLTNKDSKKEFRQIGIVNSIGNASSFTGKKCVMWAGGLSGKGYSVQGNILKSFKVLDDMSVAYEKARGELSFKLIKALIAGQNAGGDTRGRQSSAILVVRKNAGPGGVGDRYIDLRVEDHIEPIKELERLLVLKFTNDLVLKSIRERRKGEIENSLIYAKKATDMNPKIDSVYLNLGNVYIKIGDQDLALRAYREAISLNPMMKQYIKKVVARSMKLNLLFLKKL